LAASGGIIVIGDCGTDLLGRGSVLPENQNLCRIPEKEPIKVGIDEKNLGYSF
jgi:hypothetical protein